MTRFLLATALAVMLVSAGSRAVANGESGAAASNDSESHSGAYDDGGYFYSTTVSLPFADAVAKAKDELKAVGFGVLTEIDFQAKMKEKVQKDIPPYVILGACHPALAYEIYTSEEWIGIMMPCNVVVREMADGSVVVAIKDSLMLPMATGNDELQEPAEKVNALTLQFIEKMGAL